MGLTALTAASFCVFLTLDTDTLVGVFLAEALRASGLGVALRAFADTFPFAAGRLGRAARALIGLRADAFAAEARLALGLVDGFALTARFAFFADCLALERDVDRLNPFVRLLLMWDLKRLLTFASSRGIAGSLPQARL